MSCSSFLCVDEQAVMLGDCNGVLCWVPSAHLYPLTLFTCRRQIHAILLLLAFWPGRLMLKIRPISWCSIGRATSIDWGSIGHLLVHISESIYIYRLFGYLGKNRRHGIWQDATDDSFVLVCANNSALFASFVHKVDWNGRINVPLKVQNVSVAVVAASQDLLRIRWDLKIKLIKDALIFVDIAELLLEIVGHIQSFYRLFSISYVPNVHRKVISREYVVVAGRRKFSFSNRLDDLGKEILARRLGLLFNFSRVVWELRWGAKVA